MRKAMVGAVCLIACLALGCSKKKPTISRLEGAEPQRLSFGAPDKIQKGFVKQMQLCWFDRPSAPLTGYQFDTKAGLFEGTDGVQDLPQVSIRAGGENAAFLIQFYPFNNNTLITTRNLALPAPLAAKLKYDIETWTFGGNDCGPDTAPANPALQPQPSSWGASQEPAARSVNRY